MKKRFFGGMAVFVTVIVLVVLAYPNQSSAAPTSGQSSQVQQGLGDCPSATQYEFKDEQAPYTYTSTGTIDMVIIKAGSQNQGEACFAVVEDSPNPYASCYTVTGLGFNTVSVTGGGTGPNCKEISRVEFYVTHDEPIFTEEPPVETEEPTEEVTPTEEPTDPTEETPPVETEEPETQTPDPSTPEPPAPVYTPIPQFQQSPSYCVTSVDLTGLSGSDIVNLAGAQIKQRPSTDISYPGMWEISVLPVEWEGQIVFNTGLILDKNGDICELVAAVPVSDPVRVNTFWISPFDRTSANFTQIGTVEIPSIGLSHPIYEMIPRNGWVSPRFMTAGVYNGDVAIHIPDNVALANLPDGTEVNVTLYGVTTSYGTFQRQEASFDATAELIISAVTQLVTCNIYGSANVSYSMIPR